MDLDGIHRAVNYGLQAGVISSVLTWIFSFIGIGPDVCCCRVFLMFAVLGFLVTLYLDSLQISIPGRAVLVTGCDSGFGHALALRLERLGFVVFAGCLLESQGGEGAKKLKEQGGKNLHVLQLDVTSDDDVQRVLEYVKANLPSGGFWGVVNNAGWSTFGDVEWIPVDTCKKSMDVNVWGMMRVTKAFLPLIRKTKGRVVNMASGLSRMCVPDRSTYIIPKYGVQGLSDTLRYEMRKFGVAVTMIEPGNFVAATGIFTPEAVRKTGAAMWDSLSEDLKRDYGKEYFDSRVNSLIYYSTHGVTDMGPVLDAYTLALIHRYPHPRYQPMELYFRVRTLVATHLPEWVYERIYI